MTVYGVHDKGDMEYDKISFRRNRCFDRTPNKLSEMFTMAGFNVTDLKCLFLMMQIQF
jgi:hypothetical protein